MNKKVIVYVGIPYTHDSFLRLCDNKDSDFISSLKRTYGSDRTETLWHAYEKTAIETSETIKFFKNHGADIIDDFQLNSLSLVKKYDIAIIIAHHSEISDEIEFNGKLFSIDVLTNSIPADFEGYIDLASCYSSVLQSSIKTRCASPNCHVIATSTQTSLVMRMIMYQYIIKELCHCDNITESYKNAIHILSQSLSEFSNAKNESNVYLGSNMRSTVYAPASIARGRSFLVQVYIHKDKDSDIIELQAKEIDDDTVLRNKKLLSIPVHKNDIIDFALSTNQKEGFIIDKMRKRIIWQNEPASAEFIIAVETNCPHDEFIGKIKIAVNKQNAGEIIFKTVVTNRCTTEYKQAELEFNAYNQKEEKKSEYMILIEKIKHQCDHLEQLCACSSNIDDIRRYKCEADICKKIIGIIDEHKDTIHNINLSVFVSSTSDMEEYRNVVKERIEKCNMKAEMYENWGQENMYPRDLCCMRVLSSDIFVCILGPSYGYVEPEWNMSMTEIEYRAAMSAGKPILIYVLKNCTKYGKESFNVDQEQRALIDEVSCKRMIELFDNSFILQEKFFSDLVRLKTSIEMKQNV